MGKPKKTTMKTKRKLFMPVMETSSVKILSSCNKQYLKCIIKDGIELPITIKKHQWVTINSDRNRELLIKQLQDLRVDVPPGVLILRPSIDRDKQLGKSDAHCIVRPIVSKKPNKDKTNEGTDSTGPHFK